MYVQVKGLPHKIFKKKGEFFITTKQNYKLKSRARTPPKKLKIASPLRKKFSRLVKKDKNVRHEMKKLKRMIQYCNFNQSDSNCNQNFEKLLREKENAMQELIRVKHLFQMSEAQRGILEAIQKAYENDKGKIDEAKLQIDKKFKEFEVLNNELKEIRDKLQSQNTKLIAENQENQKQLEQVRLEQDQSLEIFEQKQREIDEQINNNQNLAKQITTLNDQITKGNAKYDELNKQFEALKLEAEKILQTNTTLRQQNSQLQSEKEEALKIKDNALAIVDVKNREISELKANSEKDFQTYQQKLSEYNAHEAELRSYLAELQKKFEFLIKEVGQERPIRVPTGQRSKQVGLSQTASEAVTSESGQDEFKRKRSGGRGEDTMEQS